MNIRDLNYLVAIADTSHFGKAAEACFVSQPALSMQIKKLEETLGVVLIERTNKRVMFTEVGQRIVKQAREILYQVDALKELADQAKDPFSGTLHLGVIPTLAPYLLPLIMPKLCAQYPKLTIYLVEETTGNLLTKLADGKLDGALLALPVEGDFIAEPIFDEVFELAVPAYHPLAKKEAIKLHNLENKTLLLLEDGHCLRDQALAVCHKAHASELKNFRATSLETLRHMVAAGVGITLMPKLACGKNDGICYIPFTGTIPTRTIGMVYRVSTTKKKQLEQIINQVKQQIT